MKHTFLAALFVALSWLTVQAQVDTVHFDDSIPGNWTATTTSVLSLSTDHLKGGSHSLKWAAAAGDTLRAASLGIGKGIGELYGIQFTGWLAWILRLLVFNYFMPSRKVMFNEIKDWLLLLITRRRQGRIVNLEKQSEKENIFLSDSADLRVHFR